MNIPINPQLDKILPLSTAGALPSSRTSNMLQDALDSNDIENVKAQLIHIWAHYQSLELMTNGLAFDAEQGIQWAREQGLVSTDVEDAAMRVAFRMAAEVSLIQAYTIAHASLILYEGGDGKSIPEALQYLYGGLDFTDPERELSDDELAKFFDTEAEE